MNDITKTPAIDPQAIQRLVIHGDLSKLTTDQKQSYYVMLCDACGLDWRPRPFDYLKLGGKEVLYANKNCAEQLRQNHKISISLTEKKIEEGVYIVTARAQSGERYDESTGAVSIEHLKGENRANAIMKAETKAKRRVTLSFSGLGMLDETEVDTIQGAEKVINPLSTEGVKPIVSAAQAAFEASKGITSEVKGKQEFTPEQIAEAEVQRLKKEEGERRAARLQKMPEDILAYFKAARFNVGKMIAILNENNDDPEQIRAFIKDNPLQQPQAGSLAEHLADEGTPDRQ